MRVLVAILAFQCVIQSSFAQDIIHRFTPIDSLCNCDKGYDEFGDAPAVVLENKGVIQTYPLQSKYTLTVIKRVKILTQEGLRFGNENITVNTSPKEIIYNSLSEEGVVPIYGPYEEIDTIYAKTILPNGDTVEVTKNEMFFIEGYRGRVSIAFPQVEVGSELILRYKLSCKDIFRLRP